MSEALARGFEQWNRMLIDQQQWDVKRELSNQQAQTNHMLAVEQGKDMAMGREKMQVSLQGQRMQNQLTEMKLKDEQEYRRPKQQSLYPLLGRDFVDNPEQLEAVKDTFRHINPNIKISKADGAIYSGDQPLLMSGQQMEQALPMLDLIRTGWNDTPVEARIELAQNTKTLNEMQSNYAKLKDTPHSASTRHELWKQMDSLKDDMKVLAPLATDDGALKYYNDQAGRYRTSAGLAYANYGKKAGDFLSKRADSFEKKSDALLKVVYGKKAGKTYAPTRMQIYDANPASPRYRQTIGEPFFHNPLAPVPALGEGQSYQLPPVLKNGKGDGLGGLKQMTADQMNDNLLNSFKSANPTGFVGNIMKDEMTGKYKTAVAIAKVKGESKKEDGSHEGYFTGQVFAQGAVNTMEKAYWQPIEQVDKWTVPEAVEKAKKMIAGNKPFAEWIRASGEPLNESNVKEALKNWSIISWKINVIRSYGITEQDIYTPNEFTRKMQNLGKE